MLLDEIGNAFLGLLIPRQASQIFFLSDTPKKTNMEHKDWSVINKGISTQVGPTLMHILFLFQSGYCYDLGCHFAIGLLIVEGSLDLLPTTRTMH